MQIEDAVPGADLCRDCGLSMHEYTARPAQELATEERAMAYALLRCGKARNDGKFVLREKATLGVEHREALTSEDIR